MRKTKIVATIGPACDTPDMIERMIMAGVNVFRFNMKHGDMDWHSDRMELVEQVCKKTKTRVAMLMDLQGPEVRIDHVPEEYSSVEPGDVVRFCKPGGKGIALDHPEIFDDLKKGQVIFADDGFLEFQVKKVTAQGAEVEVIEGGVIKVRKTANFPGMHLSFPALIEKDINQLSLAARHHVDFVALSFVRSKEDVMVLRKELEKHKIDAMIISKIEHPEAIVRFDEILDQSDGIMVARGDLGIEYPMEEVPALQKMIVRRCQSVGKPVIVATQMLESMIEHPRPTRAEVSDVANAVYDGADAIMLSAESAAGKYPIRSVKLMNRVALKVESVVGYAEPTIDWASGGQTAAVVKAANTLMECGYDGVCDLKAYVVLTETGKTAEYLSRLRPRMPIYALSHSWKTLDQLNMVWGVIPVHYPYEKVPQIDIGKILTALKKQNVLEKGDKVVLIHGERWGESGYTSVVRVQEVV